MEQHIGRRLRTDEIVHHINGNKLDNRIENLRIMTVQEHNILHNQKYPRRKKCVICGKEFEPYESKRKSGKVCSPECKHQLDIINASKRKKPIDQLTLDGNLVRKWDSARDIQNETGFLESNINKCCNGVINSYKGYIWRYSKQGEAHDTSA